MTSRTVRNFIPFILLFALLSLLGRELYSATPKELPSALVGEALPAFNLPTLNSTSTHLKSSDLKGHVTILNVWASWCYACNYEHDMLMKIKQNYHVPMYGILYKDDAGTASSYLSKQGNPYVTVGDDSSGDTAIDLGVYGTPEMFIINPQGRIVYRHVGAVDQSTWDEDIYPLIKKYEHKAKA